VTKVIATVAVGVASLGLVAQPATAANNRDHRSGTTQTTLKPADEADAEAAYKDARTGRVGVRYRFAGLQIVVTAIEASTKDAAVPRFSIAVRTENRSTRGLHNPEAVIACKNTKKEGNWYAESTWEPQARLRPKTFADGTLVLGYPSESYQVPVASCRRPVLRFNRGGVYRGDFPPAIQFAIPSDVLSNAEQASERPSGLGT
jgi:hypothetical protein